MSQTQISGPFLKDNAVDLAQLAHGTEGDILYYAASGVPTRLTKGTASQALRMNAGVTAPEWGTLPVAGGGTGATTLTNHGVLLGSTTCAVSVTGAGTSGQVLTSNGTCADPTFQAASGGISNVVEDTTPQLGGNLDMQANLLVGNGGTTGIAISANGEVSMAAQPAFAAFNSSDDNNVTGNSITATVDFDTEIFDQGAASPNADFNADQFTAPITGRYLLTATVFIAGGMTTSSTSSELHLVTSNRRWIDEGTRGLPDGSGVNPSFRVSAVVDMDSGDTCTVELDINGESGNVVDISGYATQCSTFFTGILLA